MNRYHIVNTGNGKIMETVSGLKNARKVRDRHNGESLAGYKNAATGNRQFILNKA